MIRKDFKCRFGPPPSITSFILADVGDNYAILQWSTTSSRQKFSFEIDYQITPDLGVDGDDTVTQKRVLPSSQKLVMIKDLKPSTNYSSSIFSYNDCSRSSPSNLEFETKNRVLHPSLSHVMPHEIILCIVVFIIWVIILRHFFVVYNRLAFVSPLSLGGYLTRKHSQPHRSSVATSRSSSRHTLISRSSGVTKFNILENAVCTWRSETVLNGRGGRRLSDNSMPYLIPSEKISRYSNLSAYPSTQRAASNTSLFTGTTRSSFSGPQIFLTATSKPNSRRPSESYHQILPPIMDDASGQSVYSCPIEMGDEDISLPSTAPFFEPMESLEAVETPKTTRKVSEVLLGKATIDIRRCSTFSSTSDDENGFKKSGDRMKRRRTLLPYFSSFRNSLRKKRGLMEALKEEKDATPIAGEFPNWSQHRRKQAQESSSLLSTPLTMHPLLTTDNSFDSYVTATDVIIKIDEGDEDENNAQQ